MVTSLIKKESFFFFKTDFAEELGLEDINFDEELDEQEVNLSIGAGEKDPEIAQENIHGFDLDAGKRWIYPTNYPVRDYQFNIVQQVI